MNCRSGLALYIVLGVLAVSGIALFSLSYFSRENRMAVRRLYHSVAADVLLDGALEEATDWLRRGFANIGSLPEVATFLTDGGSDYSRLQTLRLTIPLPESRAIARDMGFEIEGSMSFEQVRPFFARDRADSLNPESQGAIVPDPKECHGWAAVALRVTRDGFTRDYMHKREFKLVNLLPPVVSKFTLLVRNQDPATPRKGSPAHLNNLYLDATERLCLGVMAPAARTKALVCINSGADLSPNGVAVAGGGAIPSADRRAFDAADVRSNFLDKGWIFLGTPAPEGFILHVAQGQLYDYLGGKVNIDLFPAAQALGPRYVGERFHLADVAELVATTARGSSAVFSVSRLNDSGPLFPASIPIGPVSGIASHRFRLQFFGFASVTRDLEAGLPGLADLKSVLTNYYRAPAGDLGYTTADYRSQHASLLQLFGEEMLEGLRYHDSRSPTMVLGPVKRKYVCVGSVYQESDYERGIERAPGTPPSMHPAQAVRQRHGYLPWFDIDAAGRNRSNNPSFTDAWAQIVENDPDAGAPPLLPGRFVRQNYFVTQIFSTDPRLQTYYKNFAMTRFLEDPMIRSADAILHNNESAPPRSTVYSRKTLSEDASLRAFVTLGRTGSAGSAASADEGFFYATDGGVFTGSNLEIRGSRLSAPTDPRSRWEADPRRTLYRGNLRSVELFSPAFSFRGGAAAAADSAFDLRRKATHRYPTLADLKRVAVDATRGGRWDLSLGGQIVYVEESGPVVLGEPGTEIVVDGPGMLIFQGPVVIASDIRTAGTPARTGRAKFDLAPVSIVSVTGSITLKAGQVHACLVALDPENGTLRRDPAVKKLQIIGSVAVDHLELGGELLREDGANTFVVSADNLFHRQDEDWERMRIIYNDRLEPTLWENYARHYNLEMGQGVLLR